MKLSTTYILLLFFGLLLVNCSNEEEPKNISIIGEWELTEWNIGLEADINNDGRSSFNLLEEINCDTYELITIEEAQIISLVIENNPKLYLTQNEETGAYTYHLTCNEGAIGTASEYSFEENTLEAFELTYTKSDNTLTSTIEFAIEIYNEDLTEAIGLLSSTKVYTKI